MLRFRELTAKKQQITLISRFTPTSDEEFLNGVSALGISVDFGRKSQPIYLFRPVLKWEENLPSRRVSLPPLYIVVEEFEYMFNLLKSLDPYGSQTSLPEKSQDLSPVSY